MGILSYFPNRLIDGHIAANAWQQSFAGDNFKFIFVYRVIKWYLDSNFTFFY